MDNVEKLAKEIEAALKAEDAAQWPCVTRLRLVAAHHKPEYTTDHVVIDVLDRYDEYDVKSNDKVSVNALAYEAEKHDRRQMRTWVKRHFADRLELRGSRNNRRTLVDGILIYVTCEGHHDRIEVDEYGRAFHNLK